MKFDPGATDVKREIAVIGSGVFAALRPFIVEAVRDLQRARTAEDFVRLQQRLHNMFLRHQVAQERLRSEREKRKRERSRLTRMEDKPIEAIQDLSAEIQSDDQFDHILGCALHALRCVGDGIAWRAVGFDRRALSILGQGRRVGRLADDAGLAAETAEIERLGRDEGRFAVHNDLTNCLRFGDLTIPTSVTGHRDVEIAEIKRSGRTDSAQRTRLEERLDFLRSSGGSMVGGREQRVLPVAARLRTYLPQIVPVLRAARRVAFADYSPHPALNIAVADWCVPASFRRGALGVLYDIGRAILGASGREALRRAASHLRYGSCHPCGTGRSRNEPGRH